LTGRSSIFPSRSTWTGRFAHARCISSHPNRRGWICISGNLHRQLCRREAWRLLRDRSRQLRTKSRVNRAFGESIDTGKNSPGVLHPPIRRLFRWSPPAKIKQPWRRVDLMRRATGPTPRAPGHWTQVTTKSAIALPAAAFGCSQGGDCELLLRTSPEMYVGTE